MVFNELQRQRKKMLPLTLLLGGGLIVALLVMRFINASANTGDINSAEALYPNMVGSQIDTCVLCHTAGGPPSLNPYGAAYKAAGRNSGALTAIQGQDSDGDKVSNLAEIMALTFPGNPSSFPAVPTATATATATKLPSNTPTTQASATATGQSTATATSTTLPGVTATATSTKTATATAMPTLVGTATASATPNPTAVGTCKDDDDEDSEMESNSTGHDDDYEGSEKSSVSSKGHDDDDDENECEHVGPRMTKTAKPTEGAHLTRTPKPNEGPRMTKTPKATEGVRMTRTPKAAEGVRITRTPKATEIHGNSRGGYNGGSSSANWFQNAWNGLAAVFRR